MTKKEKGTEVRTVVRTQIKRLKLWRKLGVSWKAILNKLELSCTPETLAHHYRGRGLF